MGLIATGKFRNGKREWIFQRISNLAIGFWGSIFIALLLLMSPDNYAQWQAIFTPLWFKIYTSITLLVICLNSVLAGWQIGTDYVKKAAFNRPFMAVCLLLTAAYAGTGMTILWLV